MAIVEHSLLMVVHGGGRAALASASILFRASQSSLDICPGSLGQ